MEYGLIGCPLKHSFSKEVHALVSDYKYELLELDEPSFHLFMKNKKFKAINVTIPYKKLVIPYLDYVDAQAKEINAVNTIINNNGKLYGFNTDVLGVISTFENFNINLKNQNVLILGTGATSNTVYSAVKKLFSNKVYKAYRKNSKIVGDILYDNLDKIYDEINIIINTTSNGTYPNLDDKCLVDLSKFHKLNCAMDVVYNPLRTNLLIEAEKLKIKSISGLYMLIAQAIYASELFKKNNPIDNSLVVDNKLITKTYQKCFIDKLNIVLTGMPTCGKSTLGKIISEKYNYNFIDVDELIEKEINCQISDYINRYGEEKFREIESKIIKDIASVSHSVIATGGGAILKNENVDNLKHNGKIFFINRSLELLKPSLDRPLTNNLDSLSKKYNERLPIYKSTCDVEINGDEDYDIRIKNIMNNLI